MKYFHIQPEVPGERGERFSSTHVHLVFMGWMGDQLINCHPVFLATEALATKLKVIAGVESKPAEISVSEDHLEMEAELFPGRKLPSFRWLQVAGKAGESHLGLASDGSLVVSQTVLDALLATNPTLMGYEEFTP